MVHVVIHNRKIHENKINIMYILKKEKRKKQKKDPQYCIISFYSKDIPTFNELVIKNTPVKK